MTDTMCTPNQWKIDLDTPRCPVCRSDDTSLFLEISNLPIHCHLPLKSSDEALKIPRGDIHLTYCPSCGHVFNQVFDASRMAYDRGYDNSLHFSPYFQEYATKLAARLIQTYDIHHKRVVDIGCGKGDFLSILCEQGKNQGIGFDPSFGVDRSRYQLADNITIIQDFYSDQHTDYQPDLIVCRHVLEHIQDPRQFLLDIRHRLEPSCKTVLYFEVPNVGYTLRSLGIWDLIYEHCSYFSSQSLYYLFKSCGFQIQGFREDFHGQYLGIEARLELESTEPDCLPDFTSLDADVQAFSEAFRRTLNRWHVEVATSTKNGNRTVVWGAGSKGITFLNALNFQDDIKYVVDINPNKQGYYIAGTGQKIVMPEFLEEYQPSSIVVMNPAYINEVKQMSDHLGLKSKILSA